VRESCESPERFMERIRKPAKNGIRIEQKMESLLIAKKV
jgi:hypothetical protein